MQVLQDKIDTLVKRNKLKNQIAEAKSDMWYTLGVYTTLTIVVSVMPFPLTSIGLYFCVAIPGALNSLLRQWRVYATLSRRMSTEFEDSDITTENLASENTDGSITLDNSQS